MAKEDNREKALDTALCIANLCRCHEDCDEITDDVLRNAAKILAWLQPGAAELVFIVGPVTEQTTGA